MTVPAPRLIVVAGPARGSVVMLDQVVSIGRDQSSSFAIPDLALSRRHCLIQQAPAGVVIRDLDSLNGTFVNGIPVRAHTLADGDQIRVGDSALLFVQSEQPAGGNPAALVAEDRPTFTDSTVAMPPGVAGGDIALPPLRLSAELTVEHSLVGESLGMREMYQRIARAAPTDATMLILGESGTGKELVARAIHANSLRSRAPFVPINCAALPEGLLESELFGHERGAFTGALVQKRGRLEMAQNGTVFFDEIGELAPPLQAKLLRVLQERELERVGGTRAIPVDIRVVAATNRVLDAAVKQGTFRQDLYFRLNVVTVSVPPLRERRDDLPLLIAYFVRKYATRGKRTVRGVSREARELLVAYDWPGNVRELENAIERAVVLGSGEWIVPEDLPEHLLEAPAMPEQDRSGYHAGVNAAKRQIIRNAVDEAGGNYAQAARLLKLQPTYLHRLMRNLGLKDDRPRQP